MRFIYTEPYPSIYKEDDTDPIYKLPLEMLKHMDFESINKMLINMIEEHGCPVINKPIFQMAYEFMQETFDNNVEEVQETWGYQWAIDIKTDEWRKTLIGKNEEETE